jgi:long-chain fatty acid transport protein
MKKLLLSAIGFIPLVTMAGGFQVNLQGTKQTGMGHLGTSFYLGASSTYFNPAMMGMGENKINIEFGASFIMSSVVYQNQSTGISETTDNPVGTPFYLYGTYKINDKVTAGLGVYTPFGSSVEWGKDWSGKNLIQDISLRAIYIQPTLSYQFSERLRFGAGLTYVLGSFEINRAVPLPVGNDNTVNLEGSETGIGFNTGVHFQATEKLGIGLSYRSQVDIELEDGDADFTVDPSLASSFPDGKFAATLPLPATTTLGFSYQVSEALLLSVEGSFVQWSEYKSLDFDFENNTERLEDSKNPRNYDDAFIIRVGGQYSVNEQLDVRAGFYYDQSPITDQYFNPETPNTDNLGLTAGLSYSIMDQLTVDASFLMILGQERVSEYKPQNFGGKYKATSAIPGIGFNFKF